MFAKQEGIIKLDRQFDNLLAGQGESISLQGFLPEPLPIPGWVKSLRRYGVLLAP